MLRKIPHLHFSRLLGIMTTEYVDIGGKVFLILGNLYLMP